MALRFTRGKEYDWLPDKVRQQLESAFANDTIDSAAVLGRPEQAAGRQLIKHVDSLIIRAPWDPLQDICVGDYFVHTPNGGARNMLEGAILKGQGVRKGWPDYTLYLAVGRYHGLVLELKAENGGKPEPEQLDIMARLEAAGWRAAVAWGGDDAIRAVEHYLHSAD